MDLLPAESDLAHHMRMRLPDLLVARDAYQNIHGFSPCPYQLLTITSGRLGGGSLPPEVIKEASERRIVRAGRPKLFGADRQESMQFYPHNVVVTRIAKLGISAAAKVMLTPAETFTLLARASSLLSFTHGHDWTSDIAAQVGFLSMSAYHEWSHDNKRQSSPESAVSVRKWESALIELTGTCLAKIRIAKVRHINAMRPVLPEE